MGKSQHHPGRRWWDVGCQSSWAVAVDSPGWSRVPIPTAPPYTCVPISQGAHLWWDDAACLIDTSRINEECVSHTSQQGQAHTTPVVNSY